jgi:phenylalanyl-tRNA synthetase beta chain
MRAPLSWIRDFVPDLDAPVGDIADALNQLGLEVEEVEAPGAEISGVVVARILDVVAHPDADKIRLADVDFGDGQLRVVCGAPNIEPGMVVPFARVGARLPGGFEITKRKIRGVVSEGMLCSTRELGLGEDHAGILALPSNAPLGADVREVLGLDDVIFDLAITPNRPDAMGIVGVARELAAHFSLPLVIPALAAEPAVDRIGDVTVSVEATDRCPRFVGRVTSVVMGESPEWMQRRLIAAGMRPISNVVDVTNYVLLERCRPLHAFDLGRLAGRGIVVRVADDGEKMTTLDGVERTLTPSDLLVCDAQRAPQAIAGIMGGRDSEVDATTTEVLIESAYFEPSSIARSSKRLGLRSEASARFERGIDPNGTAEGADYAIALLAEVASGKAEAGAIDVYPQPLERPRISVRTPRVNAVLGTHLSAAEVRGLLEPLGIECDDAGDTFEARTPTWRPDLEREIDLVEEVARRFGLDHIERRVARPPAGMVGALTPAQRERRLIVDVLVGAGANEALTMPLLSLTDLERARVDGPAPVTITNPLRAEESVLRPSLRPGLLSALARNAAHGQPDVALFELGTVFFPPKAGVLLPDEHQYLGLLMAGTHHTAPRRADRPVDVGDALDALWAVVEALGIADARIVDERVPGFHSTRAARLVVDGQPVGAVGELAGEVLAAFNLPGPAVGFEVDADALVAATRTDRMARAVSTYPAAAFDLAIVVDDAVPAGAVERTLLDAAGDLGESVRLFDVFRGGQLDANQVSLAFALRLRAPDHTLTEAEVTEVRERAIAAVQRAHGAALRA